VAAVGAGSAAVAQARRAADHTDPELWVPDDTEASFNALLAAVSRAPSGSGRLTWQSFDGDDTIRTDLVMRATPYRHFPVGPDEPWIDATVGKARLLAIPLRYVVSYRPDPDLRSHVDPDSPFPMIPLSPEGPVSGS